MLNTAAIMFGLCLVSGTTAHRAEPPAGLPESQPGNIQIKDFRRVDPRHADRHALSTSLRDPGVSLAQSNDFANVYQLPTRPGWKYSGWYARVGGGVIAVFPHSTYKSKGTATVPPGTMYFMGSIPGPSGAGANGDGGGDASAGKMDLSIDTSVATGASSVSPAEDGRAAEQAPTHTSHPILGKTKDDDRAERIKENEERAARDQRLRELLQLAVKAEEGEKKAAVEDLPEK